MLFTIERLNDVRVNASTTTAIEVPPKCLEMPGKPIVDERVMELCLHSIAARLHPASRAGAPTSSAESITIEPFGHRPMFPEDLPWRGATLYERLAHLRHAADTNPWRR